MRGTIDIRALQHADRPAFIKLMANAFQHDPLFEKAFGIPNDPAAAAKFLSFMFDMTRIMGGTPSGAWRNGCLLGCYLMEPPSQGKLINFAHLLVVTTRFLPVAIKLPRQATGFLNAYMRDTRAVAPKTPHSYLTMIGVHPDAQGQGIGRLMLEDAISHGTDIALDTENRDNVGLYEHWGFRLCHSVVVDDVTAHCMVRKRGLAA